MPKINVYLPEALADAVRDAQVPVSAVCQAALERAVRDVTAARATDEPPDADQHGTGLFARFTPRARQAMTLAQEAARAVPHNYVGTEHLLLGLLDEGGNLALRVLAALEIDEDDLRAELAGSMPGPTTRMQGHIPFTPRAKRRPGAHGQGSPCRSATTTSAASTCCWGCSRSRTRSRARSSVAWASSSGPPAWPSPERSSSSFTGDAAGRPGSTPSTDDALARILERLDAIERRLEG